MVSQYDMNDPLIIFGLLWIGLAMLGVFVLSSILDVFSRRADRESGGAAVLTRAKGNPILQPILGRGWDDRAVFNPGAVDINGIVRLLFRAVGGDGVSRLGYAESENGITISERFSYPVFTTVDPRGVHQEARYDRIIYASGGGWGGTEDPRITKIGDTLYVTFNMFDGWDFIRVASTTIKEKDLLSKRWHFTKPLFLSPHGEVHKNWVLFPEKFEGKFAILHSLSPRIQIDFVDALEDLHTGKIKIASRYGQSGPREGWDTWVRSAGPPPIKTERGWLLMYHATEANDMSRYKIGAMLLDSTNPERVIARSSRPILEPSLWYENEWKPGIIYACGAVVRNGILFVYYGGGDQSVNVASVALKKLLDSMDMEKSAT